QSGAARQREKNSTTFREQLEHAEVNAKRAVHLAHSGIPSEGAILLLQRDPMTRGKELFKTHCAVCHRYGSDFPTGGGKASDLAGFGSADPVKRKQWIRELLEHPDEAKFFGFTPLEGMKNWRKKMNVALVKM